MRIESISYEFFGTKIDSERPAVIEISNGSNAEGYVEAAIPNLYNATIVPTLYKLLVPTSSEHRYFKTGVDLYNTTIVSYSTSVLANRNLRIYWKLDTGMLSAIENDVFCLSFWLNQALTANAVKSNINVLIKIRNFLKE